MFNNIDITMEDELYLERGMTIYQDRKDANVYSTQKGVKYYKTILSEFLLQKNKTY